MKKDDKKEKYVTEKMLGTALSKQTEEIGLMMGKGFNDVHKRIDGVEEKIESVEKKLTQKIDDVEEKLGGKIGGLSRRIDDLVDR
jgi:hypothetical protein